MTRKIRKEKFGDHERWCFSKISNVLDIPYLIEVQKDSYNWFVKDGIREVFKDFSPIADKSNHYELYFMDYSFGEKSKYDETECRDRDATFALPLRVKVRLLYKDTGKMVEQNVFMGDFPLMTANGSFIINGAERVVVSQLVRSPGVYNDREIDKKEGRPLYATTVIPSRGAWLEFKQDICAGKDNTELLHVSVDRTRKITATVLLRALGYGTDEQLFELFDHDPMIVATAEKDTAKTEVEGLIELYKRLRPGEVPTEEAVKTQLHNLFFDPKRYDCARVGRYKFNKKLNLATRIIGKTCAEDVVNADGELLVAKGEVFTKQSARLVQDNFINEVYVVCDSSLNPKGRHKVIGNNTVNYNAITGLNYKDHYGMVEFVYGPTLQEMVKAIAGKEIDSDEVLLPDEIKAIVASNKDEFESMVEEKLEDLCAKHILIDDIVATVSLNTGLKYGLDDIDNIDHLGNRRVRSVGELLQNQFRIGISRLERVIRERMATQDISEVTPQSLINVRPVSSAIKEFFGSSQLSQFMDQTNPIAELTHKRKLSALGPGGLNRDRATSEVRDVNYTHYGRMCPIETPEGQNIGLITSLSSYARINEYGFIESPYRKVIKGLGKVSDEVEYFTADEEDKFCVAQANEPIYEEGDIVDEGTENAHVATADEIGTFKNARVACRRKEEIIELPKEEIDYVDVSPKQLVSIATALIPFLENDDTNRALMGSNMQRQAVPLLKPEAPIVATGVEAKIAHDSGVMVIAEKDGVVKYVDANSITVLYDDGEEKTYRIQKFERSNQGTCVNQKPIVATGERVEKGKTLADGPSTEGGELALGRNILVGFMTWEGYNYEDAILISEKLVKEDVFTSIHIEEHEMEARDTKLGQEDITRDIPNVGDDALKNLDEYGIIRIGAEVHSGDILVGKVTPKGETELTPEERLLRAIFGDKAREVRDTSLRVPHGGDGIVVDVKIFARENKDELNPGVNKLVRVYIAQKRKISVGDKMAGRHGNKGVISRVLPEEDMPFLADGTPLQIVLNPLGVPSRMNIGQVLEVHLGLVAKALGIKISTPVFDGAKESDIKELLANNGFVNKDGSVDGKVQLFDGRTGEPFENNVTVGQMYMIKLNHLVDDKIHARSTGPYSLVTQQPLGGKAQFGGQRFGEMEVWALEAYGASHILQEILTVKSDDVVGRVKTYESIVKGNNISEPGIPESFKVLIKELQSLALDIKVLTEDHQELTMREFSDDETEYNIEIEEPKKTEEEIDIFAGEQDVAFFNDDFNDDFEDDFGDDIGTDFSQLFETDEN
ncbi:MAG: DNA-directed RNA polymerase subunit beta [Clostridia bacterium]|nr:DNA-directed RNA polymerase subunit beta [Clostridia bacterium]